eukprot:TRINITY_DN9270_c0_g1_i1.p2 TRINITY_DN9270_c0_g1~~TRINITY_DN9270_c0_g1_i1.p2  ORF type:complete len:104 (-),score=18.17 TRINITY_DN9270_c0_g1_i1:5-316(-)
MVYLLKKEARPLVREDPCLHIFSQGKMPYTWGEVREANKMVIVWQEEQHLEVLTCLLDRDKRRGKNVYDNGKNQTEIGIIFNTVLADVLDGKVLMQCCPCTLR